MRRTWTPGLALVALYLVAGWLLDAGAGLNRTVAVTTPGRTAVAQQSVDAIDASGLEANAGAAGAVTVRWQGAWRVPSDGLYDLSLGGRGRLRWDIDGTRAMEASGVEAARRTLWLEAGYHDILVTDEADAGAVDLSVGASPLGSPPSPLRSLKPTRPHHPSLRRWEEWARAAVGWLALAALVMAMRRTVTARRDDWDRWRDRMMLPGRRAAWGRALAWTSLAVILAQGALLRLDAITDRYGPVSSPRWLAALQMRSTLPAAAIRPAAMNWPVEPMYQHRDGPPTHYFSDPYIYLEDARHMPSFYAAHFREPVFPFVTRLFLGALANQDVAVSFASAFFSVLAIWLTYILGTAVWSRPVGLIAALGLSIDRDIVGLGSLGWRDDAYMAAITLCAYLLVRGWRAMQADTAGRRVFLYAAALGVACGFAVLTRFMALAFAGTGFSGLVVAGRARWRRRLSIAAVGAAAALVVAAPYFINCWRVFGDPLYTFNVHGSIYSAAEGQSFSGSTAAYVRQKAAAHPLDTIDTVTQGLTTYPFSNKWYGLDAWLPGISRWAAAAALVGLVALAATASGRLLIVAMIGSLVPFSFTWKVDPNFRFTEFVYPALLVCAAIAIDVAGRAVFRLLWPAAAGRPRAARMDSWHWWGLTVAAGLLSLWFVTRVSPGWTFRETLRAHATAQLTAGARDGVMFARGWSGIVPGGDNVAMRIATAEGSLALPLDSATSYAVSIRMDPFPRPIVPAPERLPIVDVRLNGAPIATIALHWTVDRVGSYELVLPAAAVRSGTNQLTFHVERPAAVRVEAVHPGLTDGDAVGMWYVRVTPLDPSRVK